MTGVYNPKAVILTQRRIVTLSRIANDPRLQPPVGVWAVSRSQCGRSPSQAGYPYALVSHYLTNKLMGRGPLLERQVPKNPRL